MNELSGEFEFFFWKTVWDKAHTGKGIETKLTCFWMY